MPENARARDDGGSLVAAHASRLCQDGNHVTERRKR
jgi:hypothetical protein